MFLLLIFTRGWVDLRAVVRSEGSMSLKNPVILPGIDPVTVRLIAQRLNHYATPGPAALYVLLGNILITVSITYLLNVTVVKYIWENAKWIEIAFMKSLRAHWNQIMFDITRCRIFCLPVFFPKLQTLRYTRGVQVKPGLLILQVWKGMLAWRYYTQQ